MGAVDSGLGIAGIKTYSVPDAAFVVVLFDATTGECVGVHRGEPSRAAAHRCGERRRGEVSRAARARPARHHRLRLPGGDAGRVHPRRRADDRACRRVLPHRGEPRRSSAHASAPSRPSRTATRRASRDIVVTATTSKDPVLRGEWLRDGALVCAVGANHPSRRELDDVVLERATFVCCDSREQARLESGDLIEPVANGVLDWLEVHELQEVVAGEVRGRQSDDDIVVFKSNGLAAWDVAIGAAALERARERGVGTDCSRRRQRRRARLDGVVADGADDVGAIEQPGRAAAGVEPVAHVRIARGSPASDRPRSCSRMT